MSVTIYDVARQADVSTATVSKVLSNTPYVSEKTRAKVLAVVSDLDFVPNLAARSLNQVRTGIIGLAFPYASDYLFEDPHLMLFLRGVENIATTHDYSILLMTAGAADAAGGLRRLLHTRYVDGAIVVGMESVQPITAELRHRTYPTVALGYHSPLGVYNTIHADDYLGGRLAAEHLLALGHRRIGLIGGPLEITAVGRRIQGFTDALTEHGLSLAPDLRAAGDFTQESGFAAAASILAQPARPTAIFSVNDRMALGFMAYAQASGLTIPTDLSIVGFDDIPAAAFSHPSLTTVCQPSLAMGRMAGERLLDLVQRTQERFEPLVLATTFVPRNSTRALT
ncbi:MAG: LacI family DNA-binding transcriptional regulator [Anaerolineae bacterium]